jgi:plasmid stability protein
MMVVPTLYLRDVPATLVESLKRRARRNRRSMNAEAVAILQQALDAEQADDDLVARLRSLQYTVPDGMPTGVDLIRMDRDERDRRSRR